VDLMARTIAVSDEIYQLLKRHKLPGESFSDVIRRLATQRGPLTELIGRKTIPATMWPNIQNQLREAEKITKEKMGS